MGEVRAIVNLVLAERISKGIKVKQPLSSVKVKNDNAKIVKDDELLDLIKDEVNVKVVSFDKTISSEIELDINITDELKEEGTVREIVRAVQDIRKKSGLKPSDEISANFSGDEKLISIIKENREFLSKEVKAKEIIFNGESENKIEIIIEGKKILLNIKKI